MTVRLAIAFAAWAFGSLSPGPSWQPAANAPASGVRVESTGPPWSGASQAGLRPGDVIVAWARPEVEPAGTHAVATLADWSEAEAEHGLREAGVVVSLVRDGQISTAPLRGGAWFLGVAPLLSGERLAEHQRAAGLAGRGEQAEAATVWRRLAQDAAPEADAALSVWLWLRAAGAEMAARRPVPAASDYGAARAAARERGLPFLERDALDGLARAEQARQQPLAAEAALTDAIALMQSERPMSPALVRTLNALGAAQREFGRLDDSERTFTRALDTAAAVCPGSIAEVAALGGLSLTKRRRGDLVEAERLLDLAARALERFPGHPDRIANAGNRGILLVEQHRLAEGERFLQLAESLDRESGAPPVTLALRHHANLGVIAAQRGDLARAEGYFRSFLDAADKASIDPLDRVRGLSNLATIASERGDDARALPAFEAALTLAATAAPGSAIHADALGNVGGARARAGNWAGSAAAYDEALRIRRAISPDEVAIASLLWSLATNAERQGDLALAATHAAAAVAHAERTAPDGIVAARAYHVAARVALARGATDDGRRLQERGLAIAQALVPGSRVEVAALATLAAIDVRDRRLAAARERYAAALAALEAQVRRLGAPLDLEAGYVDAAGVQRPFVDTLLALGDDRRAFEVLESVRARAVLDRLAARDLTLGRAAEAQELARDRRRLAQEYDETLAQLAAAGGGEKAAALVERLRTIRGRQAAAASALRRADGADADPISPSARPFTDLQRALPPGTLALAYHLGDRPSVFVVTRDAFTVRPLEQSAADIAGRVDRWRRLVERGRSGPSSDPALDDEAAALFDVLIGPVATELRAATRLLVLPDGPLHGLPFAALRGTGGPGARRYLAQALPVTVAPSLTALTTLAQRPRRAAADLTVEAFADVAVTAPASGGVADQAVRGQLTTRLAPLPGSRREAEDIAALFAPRSAVRLGAAATESALKRVPRATGILHLASHGLVNDASPLDSAIVLSPDADGGNGLLQAWEVFDELRIDADLVVLSACDTGLGRAFAGEGLLGLTRAFQFAGARAVLASLWTAPDEATAGLMGAFYRRLRAGGTVDDALVTAQRDALARPESRHPYFWAGFVVDGAVD